MRKFLAKAAVVMAVLFASVFGLAGTARAAWYDCPIGWACLWVDGNYSGQMVMLPGISPGYCWPMPAGWNDVASSVVNRISWANIELYTEGGCWGAARTFYANGGGTGNLWPINDAVSSYRYYS